MRFLLIFFYFPLLLFSQNKNVFNIELNKSNNDVALQQFSKYINVLNCIHVYSESSVSDDKILHVASVIAELIDNNEDGIIDDSLVFSILKKSNVVMPIFSKEGSKAEKTFSSNFNGCKGAVLYQNEVNPTRIGEWPFDATFEEVLHTINNCGQVKAYPEVFGLTEGSILFKAMDIARGGNFKNIPSEYPDKAWYHYNDETCEYDCMAIEYLYWSIGTNMGLFDNDNICLNIKDEWELCSPELFRKTDLLMFSIINDNKYCLPKKTPDGRYEPNSN